MEKLTLAKLDSDWEGWRVDPCGEDTLQFFTRLTERLALALEREKIEAEHPSFGHADDIQSILHKAQNIRILRSQIQEITKARQDCSKQLADS